MSNFKSAAKRKRELAKLDKRLAKDQKRAVRKAERSAVVVGTDTPTAVAHAEPSPAKHAHVGGAAPVRKPMTLAEAVELWKTTKVVKHRRR